MADIHTSPTDVHHETADVNLRVILGYGLALMIAAVVIAGLVWLLFVYFSAREANEVAPMFPLATEQERRMPPEPRLQTNPRQDLLDLRAQEDQMLTTYGWVDKNAGVARIPIDEAMKLTIERGLPTRPAEVPRDAR